MFATHYHELCALENVLAGVVNMHVMVHEQRGRIVFLHQIAPGAAGRSYGVQVGRLAGLPSRVLRRAARILERLEADPRGGASPQLDLFSPQAGEAGAPLTQAGPDAEAVADIVETLADLEVDELSPRAAHDLLRQLVAKV